MISRGSAFAGLAFAVLLTSFIIGVTHDNTDCKYSTNGSDWKQCTDDHSITCNTPAVDIMASLEVLGQRGDFDLVCPWRQGTSVVTYISLALSAIFLLGFIFSPRLKSFNMASLLLIGGILTMGFLIASFVMMIIDIVDGYNTVPDDYKKAGFEYTTSQAIYFANAILTFLGFVIILFLTISGFKTHSKGTTALLHHEEGVIRQH